MRHEVQLPSPGNIWKVLVSVGSEVQAGDTLLIMEVMKMEVPVDSPVNGQVTEVLVNPGDEGLDANHPAIVIEGADNG